MNPIAFALRRPITVVVAMPRIVLRCELVESASRHSAANAAECPERIVIRQPVATDGVADRLFRRRLGWATAAFRFRAASGPFQTAFLSAGAATLALGTALQAFFAAAEFDVCLAAGTGLFAAIQLGSAAVDRFWIGAGKASDQKAGRKQRTSQ